MSKILECLAFESDEQRLAWFESLTEEEKQQVKDEAQKIADEATKAWEVIESALRDAYQRFLAILGDKL